MNSEKKYAIGVGVGIITLPLILVYAVLTFGEGIKTAKSLNSLNSEYNATKEEYEANISEMQDYIDSVNALNINMRKESDITDIISKYGFELDSLEEKEFGENGLKEYFINISVEKDKYDSDMFVKVVNETEGKILAIEKSTNQIMFKLRCVGE